MKAYVEIPLNNGMVTLVDVADAETLPACRWYARAASFTHYAQRHVRRTDGRWSTAYLHKVLTGWERTDHINGDGLDNRRANLRPATNAQNMFNQRKFRGGSRFKGVCWRESKRRWRAQIHLAGRTFHLGYFRDEEDAARAYDAAAREHFGDYAAPNFPALTP